ncbi:MAG TPA: hypothetical protein PLJ30_13750, partial [Deltaproteobacteria bacterium]|nr:hypothetical protein [Deltaproteobacteria bacterium]
MVEASRLKAKRRDREVLLLEKSSKGQAEPVESIHRSRKTVDVEARVISVSSYIRAAHGTCT